MWAGGFRIGATGLIPATGWHVSLEQGTPDTGAFPRYMTTFEARDLAAALIAQAEFYDAESRRLAAARAVECVP